MDRALAQLERRMVELIDAHERLLALLKRKHEALRGARAAEVASLCELENRQVQAIGEMEKQRQQAAAEVTLALDPKAAAPLTLLEIAERIGEPKGGRLRVHRARLRGLIDEARRQSRVTGRATERLLQHVQGLVQTVVKAVGGGGTYGRGGCLHYAATEASSFTTTG